MDHGASDIEAYVSSWRYLIAVELATLVIAHPKGSASAHAKPLQQFLTDNYGGTNPELSDILRPSKLRLEKFSLQPSIMGNQLGSVSLNRPEDDHQFGLELNALANSIFNAVEKVSTDAKLDSLSLHFDELDQGLSALDEARSKMLIGLVLAARDIKRNGERQYGAVNPVVYLRTDLWDELQFSDKNKISQTLTFHLEWNPKSLLDLVETRLRAKLSSNASWSDISDDSLMRGSQSKWNHILARTFLRPRDVIRFLNTALERAKERNYGAPLVFLNEDIVGSREDYSSYLKQELDDEIRPHWAYWDEALQACSAISTITFERGLFEEEYAKRKSAKNPITASEALSLLYRFSVVGYERRSGYGGSSWAFQYTDPEAGWDNVANRFKVHLGLKEYAKLRETRE
ncbi:hypothetical protein J2R76_007862 [Bradyrhizobium sp. USDA 4532]|nr:MULTISPECIES: hypothetical protein [unclassified Bradyrhizobium]MCP1831162.1 hypothetical protein [Bradyrhizobium sp. USDA 4545]MCP1924271.1 hypothetical protein [Bradyrhizobium sp. USDA 4532]